MQRCVSLASDIVRLVVFFFFSCCFLSRSLLLQRGWTSLAVRRTGSLGPDRRREAIWWKQKVGQRGIAVAGRQRTDAGAGESLR